MTTNESSTVKSKETIKQYKEKQKIYKSFELDRLIKLMKIRAIEKYDGHFSIFSFTSGYKIAFGTPSDLYVQLWPMPSFEDLKEGVIFTLLFDYEFPNEADALNEYHGYIQKGERDPLDFEVMTSGESAREFYITEIA